LIDFVRSGNFDSIQIEGVHLLTYLPALRAAAPRARIISDWHNIESEILRRYSETNPNPLRRLAARRTAQLLEAEELRLLRQCDAHCVASDRERERLLTLAPGANITTIPNGVDFEFFRPREEALDPTSRRDILFVGSMDYHANIDAAVWLLDEIWPQMRTRLPGYRLLIVGRNPSPALRSRASEECIITGTVDDVRPYYDSAAAVVTPLRVGSGTRLKILEAMAAGVPVVSTSLGAEGIAATPDRDILIADTPIDLTNATERVVSSPAIWKQLSAAGMALVRDQYGWPSLGQRLFAVHERLSGAGNGN
jgi:glycosyltransferase involved in cell wall biosynthesis